MVCCPLRRVVIHDSDRTDKAVPAPRERFDPALATRRLSERVPNSRDLRWAFRRSIWD